MKRSLITMLVVLALSLGICVSGMLLIRHVALEMEEMRVNAVKLLEAGKTDEAAEQIKQILLTEKRQKAYQSRINQLKILYPVERP